MMFFNKKPDLNQPSSEIPTISEHLMELSDLSLHLNSSIDVEEPSQSVGVSNRQVQVERFGSNQLNLVSPPSPIVQYILCLCTLFNLLLFISSLLCFLLVILDPSVRLNLYLGIILLSVVFINGTVEYVQLQKSQSVLSAFQNLLPRTSTIIQSGSLVEVLVDELVVGDLVYLTLGTKVPADCRVIKSSDLKVDNSSLTGESEPIEVDNQVSVETNFLESKNLVFNGSLVVSGYAYCVVIRVGRSTVLGQVANLTSNSQKSTTPLTLEINRFVKLIFILALITAIIFFSLSLVVYKDLPSALTFSIGVFLSWVPEGLPATVTMLLSIAAQNMLKQNVLVKDLKAVETLGALTLLATDKTGTLTRNQMTVTSLWSSLTLEREVGSSPFETNKERISELILNVILNSKVRYDRENNLEERKLVGDATEVGLYKFVEKLVEVEKVQQKFQLIFEKPFNSTNKFAFSVVKSLDPKERGGSEEKLTLYLKGAPERVIKLCTSLRLDNQDIKLTSQHQLQFEQTYDYMASQGHRVIGFAQIDLPTTFQTRDDFEAIDLPSFLQELTFTGLISLQDPPKHEVREAIGRCRLAGIQVVMVTGDHPKTAEAIARKVNLMTLETQLQLASRTGRPLDSIGQDEFEAVVIHGDQLSNFTDLDWVNVMRKKEVIFARTSPQNKLEIVQRFQSLGHIVGVTGDGVNDAPALKKADLGIAMNLSGSDVSKDAANMILLDDNFASVVQGIEQGRLIFNNLKKSIKYTVTHTLPEVVPQLLYVAVPLPVALTSILIVVTDLGFELLVALSFAWDVPESKEGLMRVPPRKPVTAQMMDKFLDQKEDAEVEKDRWYNGVQRWFTFDLNNEGGEVLIDFSVLSWALFEAGILEALFCTFNFFFVLYSSGLSPYDLYFLQVHKYFDQPNLVYISRMGSRLDSELRSQVLAQAQSTFYLSLMLMQGFNLFAVKGTKLNHPLARHALMNRKNFYGLLAGFALGFGVVYIPFLQPVFDTWNVDPIFLLVPIAGGCTLLLYATLKFYLQRYVHVEVGRKLDANLYVKGLDNLDLEASNFTLPLPSESKKWEK